MTEIGRMLREDGIKEGREEGKIEIARNLLKERLMSKEEIARISKLSPQKIEEIEQALISLKVEY